MTRIPLIAALAVALGSWAAGPAAAQQTQPIGPWNGQNPFTCQLQDVGTGSDIPDPGADPFCVEFDKNSQNVTDFGLADFLANEPTRVAAAAPKCFYFQRDHWTGSVVQGQPPELWHWDGDYFFDKAKGVGGVHVDNFEVLDQPADFRPYAPPQYQPFLEDGGGGGVIVLLETDPDPTCVAKAEAGDVYAGQPLFDGCVSPGGELKKTQVGHVALGMSRDHVLTLLGSPHSQKNGTDRWCVIGDGELRVGYRGGEVSVILTSVLGHTYKGIRAGTPRRKAVRRLDLERRFRAGGTAVFETARKPGRRLFVGIAGGSVEWLAVTDSGISKRAAKRALRKAAD